MSIECGSCDDGGLLYERRKGKRCVHCGWTTSPPSIADEYPTREANAKCGDIISDEFGGVSRACVRRRMCQDDTACSIRPSGIAQMGENTWVVVCHHHDDEG